MTAPAQKLSSSQIPQADRPERLAEILERLRDGLPVDDVSLQLDYRQVGYYTDAAEMLGFLSEDRRLTRAGRALLSLDDQARKARIAIALENSACGQAWMAFYRVKSLCNVYPNSVFDFLEQASEITGTTVPRRGRTLRTWWREYIPYHPSQRQEPSASARRWPAEALGHTAVLDARESARVVQALGPGTALLRVASGFLSVGGFEILAESLHEAWMQLLVGYDSAIASVEDLLSEFRRSLEEGPPTPSKQATVRNLYRNISVGPVNVRYFDPRYKPHLHAKVYLFDEFAAYVTSANLSRSGLRTNIEGGYVVRDAPAIEYFRKRFDELFGMAEDMRSKLLSELEQCWVFEPLIEPYLLYLRVLIELYPSVDDLSRRTERQLAKFQELIVGAVLHELRNKRGSLLISPTGTGKTVMAMYAAASLHQKREVDRVLVLCPNERLRAKWEQEADLFRLHVKAVTHGIVQGKGKPAEGVEQRLQRVLSQAHPGDLIIVDECHVFRNRETNGFENLARFIGDRRREDMPRLLLLSATPMSKGLADLNAQLGLIGAPALSTIEEVARAEGIINVTLPFIVKHFGTDGRGGTGTGLAYPHGLLHFGTVVTTTKSYPLPSRAAFEHIENMNLRFRVSLSELQQMALPGMEAIADVRSRSASGLLKLILLRRAESSPRAARDTIKQLLSAEGALIPDDPQAFQASLTELAGMLPEPAGDTKLHVLARMLKERPARQRVLVFSMWAATVEYLAEALPAFLGPEHRTASITGSLSFTERCKIIRRFAPAAQGRPRRQRRDDIDILIATDAIAEGEDLQDADVVVNYDLPWTPLLLIQRVGRVDRPTKHSRVIELWNFYPEEDLFERQVRLWRRLDDRADLYGRMSRTHVLGEHERQLVDLEERDLGLVSDLYAEKIDFDHLRTEYIPASEVLRDRASASSDALARAGSLPLGSRSCKVGLEPGIFMLVRVGDKLSCVFHPADAGPLEESPRVSFHERLLRHVRALPNTAVAPLPENFDETLCNLIERFARESLVEPEDVTVIVAEAIVGPERVSAEAVPVREVP